MTQKLFPCDYFKEFLELVTVFFWCDSKSFIYEKFKSDQLLRRKDKLMHNFRDKCTKYELLIQSLKSREKIIKTNLKSILFVLKESFAC